MSYRSYTPMSVGFGQGSAFSSDPFNDPVSQGPQIEGPTTIEKIESTTGTIASIAGHARRAWDAITGDSGNGATTTVITQSGDPDFTNDSAGSESGDGASGAAKRVIENLWDTLRGTVEAGLRGGAEGAVAASSGAAAGTRVGAGITGLNMTLVLGGVLVLVLFLRK